MWLETSTVTPAAPISRISSMKRARCPGSIPVIGSSSTSRAGWWTIAPATLVRWRSPLDSPLRRRSASGAMSTSAMARSAAAPGSVSPWSSACSRTYERTVSRGYSRSPSGTTPIARYSIGSRWMGRPNSSTSPWEGWSSPQMAFRVVVLPAPLGPSSPVTPGPQLERQVGDGDHVPVPLGEPPQLDNGPGGRLPAHARRRSTRQVRRAAATATTTAIATR